MDINLIKNYIEKSDFDENIIFNTDINTNLEKSIFNNINEAVELIKKLDKFIDNEDFLNILKEISKKFLLIKNKKCISFETKNIESCVLKYSNILSFNAEYTIVMGYYFILKFETATVVGINKSLTEKTVIGFVNNVVTCQCCRFSGWGGDILRFNSQYNGKRLASYKIVFSWPYLNAVFSIIVFGHFKIGIVHTYWVLVKRLITVHTYLCAYIYGYWKKTKESNNFHWIHIFLC